MHSSNLILMILSILGIGIIGTGVYAVWSEAALTAYSHNLFIQLRKAHAVCKLPSFISTRALILAVVTPLATVFQKHYSSSLESVMVETLV